VAGLEQKFPQFLCFIKGEANGQVDDQRAKVAGVARVTHEVGVAIESLDPTWVGNFRARPSKGCDEVKFNGTVSYEGGLRAPSAVSERSHPGARRFPYRADVGGPEMQHGVFR
jgi:hypothetical protein